MIFDFCTKCGNKLEKVHMGDDECKKCPSCGQVYGTNPFPIVAVLVINEFDEVLLLKQNYISEDKWTIVTGYMVDGETIEEAVVREVKEETGQDVISYNYVSSYYFAPKRLILIGFMARVNKSDFGHSQEVDDLRWYKIDEVNDVIARENNYSGEHFDRCMEYMKG